MFFQVVKDKKLRRFNMNTVTHIEPQGDGYALYFIGGTSATLDKDEAAALDKELKGDEPAAAQPGANEPRT